jgi:hypothetical protein
MGDILKSTALEIADNWDQMAATELNSDPARRSTLRWCADVIRMMASRQPLTCPHATSPLRYCMQCPVDPCPIEIGAGVTK